MNSSFLISQAANVNTLENALNYHGGAPAHISSGIGFVFCAYLLSMYLNASFVA